MERSPFPPSLLLLLLLLLHCSSALWLGECNKPLGVSTGELLDSALTASSAHDHIVGPHRARLGMEGGGGAWCPRAPVDTRQEEWLEVDFGAPRLLTAVATQGRHANGQGVEYTPAYTLSYWRPGMPAFDYYSAHPNLANKTLLVGNSDTFTEVKNTLARPVLAARVRLQPFSAHPRVVCLRLELYGCNYTDGLLSYSVGGGPYKTYVGAGVGDSVSVGEGLLYDGRVGGQELDATPTDTQEPLQVEGLEPAPGTPVLMVFNFDVMRRFRALYFYLTTSQLGVQPKIKSSVMFGWNSSVLDESAVATTWVSEDLSPAGPQNLTLDLRQRPAATLQVEVEVSEIEVNILEVYFDSSPCGCGLGDWERRPVTTPEEHTAARPPHPPADVWAVYTAHQHRTYVGVAVGFSVGVGVLVLVWAGVWLRRRRGKASSPRVFRRPPPDTLDMKSLMEGVGVGVNILGSTTPTYEEGSCLLYDDLQKTPLVTPYSTLRPATPDSAPVYATPAVLRPSSTFPSTSSFTPIPRPVTLASISRPPPMLPRPPPIPAPPENCERQIQVPSVTGPWLTCVYRQDPGRLVTPTPTPMLAPERVTRTGVLASGAFATLSVGVVSEDGSQGLEEEERCEGEAPPPRHAALITVTAHQAAPAVTRQAQLLAALDNKNLTRLLGVVVGGPVGVTLVLEYQADAHLPEYLHARTLAPADYAHATTTRPHLHPQTSISVGDLLDVAVQVAAGMAFLESHRVSHTDMAARNVVVVGGDADGVGVVKVTQVGSALPRYSSDYWRPPDGRGPAPLRWCSPEVLCQGTFSSAGDVWSFGVTLWEILTLARRRPHHHLSDDLLFHALLSTHAHAHSTTSSTDKYATPQVVLSPPAWCPREVQEVMSGCWRPHPSHRLTFTTIHAKLAAYALSHE
ncbi:discoidin domain-containing receptor 2 [Procambarus clarkii]|uniref:discoidin domain-containing receptor 2 n=1 Tax=Procambarus clarkii TaxID=6728 RepID=UPI00374400CF